MFCVSVPKECACVIPNSSAKQCDWLSHGRPAPFAFPLFLFPVLEAIDRNKISYDCSFDSDSTYTPFHISQTVPLNSVEYFQDMVWRTDCNKRLSNVFAGILRNIMFLSTGLEHMREARTFHL